MSSTGCVTGWRLVRRHGDELLDRLGRPGLDRVVVEIDAGRHGHGHDDQMKRTHGHHRRRRVSGLRDASRPPVGRRLGPGRWRRASGAGGPYGPRRLRTGTGHRCSRWSSSPVIVVSWSLLRLRIRRPGRPGGPGLKTATELLRPDVTERRRAAALAGHVGDEPAAASRPGRSSAIGAVTALGALDRLGVLTESDIRSALEDQSPDGAATRLRAGRRTSLPSTSRTRWTTTIGRWWRWPPGRWASGRSVSAVPALVELASVRLGPLRSAVPRSRGRRARSHRRPRRTARRPRRPRGQAGRPPARRRGSGRLRRSRGRAARSAGASRIATGRSARWPRISSPWSDLVRRQDSAAAKMGRRLSNESRQIPAPSTTHSSGVATRWTGTSVSSARRLARPRSMAPPPTRWIPS